MEEAVLDQSARVTHIPAPVSSPGHCALCGKSDHPEGFAAADNLDFEFFGTFYLCADCVGDYARIFGFMSKTELADLLVKQKSMSEELEILRESVANLENIVDAYAKLRPNAGISRDRSIGDVVASADTDEGTSQAVGEQLQLGTSDHEANGDVTDGSVSSGEVADNDTDESARKQGADDVSSTSSNVTELFAELGI